MHFNIGHSYLWKDIMHTMYIINTYKGREGKWCVAKYGDPYSEFVLCI